MTDAELNDIRDAVRALAPRTVEWRRDFHRHPEVAFHETRTSSVVARALTEMGCDVRPMAGTGMRADITGAGPGRTVALRSDMDALPVTEADGKACVSETPGACHACGHDAHMATLLTAAKVLSDRRASWRGRVALLFQPAEELHPGGAAPMIADGALDGVDAIFGLHYWQPLPSGKVGMVKGAMMAASDRIRIHVTGKGGHAALPHLSADPVLAASQIVVALQSVVSRNVDPLKSAVVSICEINGGTVDNVIPPDVTLVGTARSFDPGVRDLLAKRIVEVATNTAAAYGASAAVAYERGYPPVVNDAGMVDFAAGVVARALGADRLYPLAPVMGGEDFALYLEKVPGAFMFFGSGDGMPFPHHHPSFDIDERVLPDGALLMTALALDYLGRP